MDIQLYLDGLLNLAHILLGKNAGSSEKPLFANGRQLIRHGLAFLSFKDDCRLAEVKAIYIPGEKDNLNSL